MITIGFKEKETGWVSFFRYLPDAYMRLGGTAFVIKNGDLWQQNDKGNPITNTFFGTKYASKINTVFNDVQTEDKIFKNFIIEGNAPWEVNIKTNLTETSLKTTDFDKKESRYFAFLRGNEKQNDFNGNSQGIGVCRSFSSNILYFDSVSSLINVGDKVFRLEGENTVSVGTITEKGEGYITLDSPLSGANGFFFFSTKNERADGGEIRGYYADVEMINNDDRQVELFAINSNIVKSYV